MSLLRGTRSNEAAGRLWRLWLWLAVGIAAVKWEYKQRALDVYFAYRRKLTLTVVLVVSRAASCVVWPYVADGRPRAIGARILLISYLRADDAAHL